MNLKIQIYGWKNMLSRIFKKYVYFKNSTVTDGKIRCLGLLQNNPVGRGATNESRLAGMGFDFIVIVPFLPHRCGFSFVFGRVRCLFFTGSSILQSMFV